MKFFAVTAFCVALTAASFEYTWTPSGDECKCSTTDTADDIQGCVDAVVNAECSYTVVASWTPEEGDLKFVAGAGVQNQQVFKLPDELISHGLDIPDAVVTVHTDLSIAVYKPEDLGCSVTPGAYKGNPDTSGIVDPSETGPSFALPKEPSFTIDYGFITKEADYILITSDEDECDLHADVGVFGGSITTYFEYTFIVNGPSFKEANAGADSSAYTGTSVETANPAYTGTSAETANPAYTGTSAETANPAYTGTSAETANPAYTGTSAETANPAYTGTSAETANPAYTGTSAETANPAYTGASAETANPGYTGTSAETANPGYTGTSADTATGRADADDNTKTTTTTSTSTSTVSSTTEGEAGLIVAGFAVVLTALALI